MMNRASINLLDNAAIPALVLMAGMVVCLALSYVAGVPWTSLATKCFYGALFLWGLAIAWHRRSAWSSLVLIDKCALLFVLLVVASFGLHGETGPDVRKYLQYLPFLVVTPFILGRVMRREEFVHLMRGFAWVGPVVLAFAALNYWMTPETVLSNRRWIFFGYDHTPLLIGFVLAGSVIATTSRMLKWFAGNIDGATLLLRIMVMAIHGLCLVALVLVTARGALFGALLATLVLLVSTGQMAWQRKTIFLLYVCSLVLVSLNGLPKSQGLLYAQLDVGSIQVASSISAQGLGRDDAQNSGQVVAPLMAAATVPVRPLLGEASCHPFKEGMNSVAMRWVMYREAVAAFMHAPWLGVGAAMFGFYSCSGRGGFPHSTILQAMAELGLPGLMLLTLLMGGAFSAVIGAMRTKPFPEAPLILAFLVFYVCTDQIYGNYFMAAGTSFFAGLAANVRTEFSKAIA